MQHLDYLSASHVEPFSWWTFCSNDNKINIFVIYPLQYWAWPTHQVQTYIQSILRPVGSALIPLQGREENSTSPSPRILYQLTWRESVHILCNNATVSFFLKFYKKWMLQHILGKSYPQRKFFNPPLHLWIWCELILM